jgi:hypothetical protein
MMNRKKLIITSTNSANNIRILDGSTVLTAPPEESADNAHSLESLQQRHKGLKKWGIPHKSSSPSEVILLERLVWVRYRQRYWWPAIMYKNYKEIAQQASQVWNQLFVGKRLYLASRLIYDPSNDKNHVQVARLLGRCELVEAASHSEFYWELPNVLPKASCNVDYFRNDPDLYYDWHRALDDVERILRECLGEQFALMPEASQRTWLERARHADRSRWVAAATKPMAWFQCCTAKQMEGVAEDDNNDIILTRSLKVY